MKKKLGILFLFASGVVLASCGNETKTATKDESTTTVETATLETTTTITTTETVMEDEKEVHLVEDVNTSIFLLPNETMEYEITIPYDGRYNISTTGDVKVSVDDGKSFPIKDAFYKANTTVKVALTISNSIA